MFFYFNVKPNPSKFLVLLGELKKGVDVLNICCYYRYIKTLGGFNMNKLETNLKRLGEAETWLERAETEKLELESTLQITDGCGDPIAHFDDMGWLYLDRKVLEPEEAKKLATWLTNLYE